MISWASLGASPANGLPSGSVLDIADNILLFQFIRLRSRFHRSGVSLQSARQPD